MEAEDKVLFSAEQKLHFARMGYRFGYPGCCVASFIGGRVGCNGGSLHPGLPPNCGFIPCEKCLQKDAHTLRTEINLKRDPSFPPFSAEV